VRRIETSEETTGCGEVFHQGVSLGSVGYTITVTQEIRETTAIAGNVVSSRGAKDIRGRIGADPAKLFELFQTDTSQAPLTLHLEDGRRWDFGLTNLQGDAVNTGEGLRRPEEKRSPAP
jgi:hypothetical protein